jgi:type II secretory pathway component PulK
MIARSQPHLAGGRLLLIRRRRGAAFIITVWILAAITGITLALGHAVSVEADAAADRAALAEASFAETGAEQFAMSWVDDEIADPGAGDVPDIQAMMGGTDPTSGMQIGNCRVWIIKPNPDDETTQGFGLRDEAGELDLTTATAAEMINLPNISQENVDCIVDWQDADSNEQPQGAEEPYYNSLPDPYHCKNAKLETIEELNLVKSIATDDSGNPTNLLYGMDTAHCGVVSSDANPALGAQAGGMTSGSVASGQTLGIISSNRGIYPFITVYGVRASTVPTAQPTSGLAQVADVNSQDQTILRRNLQQYLGGGNVNQILQMTAARLGGGGATGGRGGGGGGRTVVTAGGRFGSVLDWASSVNLTQQQFSNIIHYVKASSGNATALINVNDAPLEVLMCLPSLTQTDAQAIVDYVSTNPSDDPSDISWMLSVLPKAKLSVIGDYVTGVSYCYSADIVAATLDGRAFKRVRVVIDASSGVSKIIYRRDLTSLGWPLPPEYRPKPNQPQ